MEKLEKPKKKHDHLLTKLLKFSIFALVMLAPFISVISKVAYVTFNKNAKDSYSNNEIITLKEIANADSLVAGERYQVQYLYKQDVTQGSKIYYDYISVSWNSYNPNILDNNVYAFALLTTASSSRVYLYNESGTYITSLDIWGNTLKGFEFTFNNTNQPEYFNNANARFLHITYQTDTLDNAMTYAINQLQNDNLYNWSKNTGIYNAILGMTEGLGANNTLAMLLAYWSIITAIYIVFDIVIEIFIKLTHLLN